MFITFFISFPTITQILNYLIIAGCTFFRHISYNGERFYTPPPIRDRPKLTCIKRMTGGPKYILVLLKYLKTDNIYLSKNNWNS